MSVNSDTDPLISSLEEGADVPRLSRADTALTGATSPHGRELRKYNEVAYPTLKRRYWKNLILLSVSVMLVFISYASLQNLESTLNSAAGLGIASLATVYFTLALGCIFSPLVVDKTGAKGAILIMFSAQILFAGANFYPRYWTLIPASGLVGLTSAFFWTGIGGYIMQAATGYSSLVATSVDKVINTFSGVFVGFWQSSQVVGNLVSSFVLRRNSSAPHYAALPGGEGDSRYDIDVMAASNETLACGADFCNFGGNGTDHNVSSNRPEQGVLYILLGTYLGCCVLGTALTFFGVDRRPGGDGVDHALRSSGTAMQKTLATLKQHRDFRIILLLPLFVYNGLSQGYIFSDYTQAYVSCIKGVSSIGFVMVTFGAVDAISSLGVGALGNYVGRIPLFLAAASINTAMLLVSLFVDPFGWPDALFYVIPGLWGISDAIWQTKSAAMLGVVFKEDLEPSWACYLLWQAVGMALGFVGSRFLCVGIKIYIMLVVLWMAMILYITMEVKLSNRTPKPTSVTAVT